LFVLFFNKYKKYFILTLILFFIGILFVCIFYYLKIIIIDLYTVFNDISDLEALLETKRFELAKLRLMTDSLKNELIETKNFIKIGEEDIKNPNIDTFIKALKEAEDLRLKNK